jgi:hypothetical protein
MDADGTDCARRWRANGNDEIATGRQRRYPQMAQMAQMAQMRPPMAGERQRRDCHGAATAAPRNDMLMASGT